MPCLTVGLLADVGIYRLDVVYPAAVDTVSVSTKLVRLLIVAPDTLAQAPAVLMQ